MKTILTFLFLCTISSAAFGARSTCSSKVLAQASLIKQTSLDIVRATDDAIDMQLDKTSDSEITAQQKEEAARAQELVNAVRELQSSPDKSGAPILTALCKNNLSVQKTVAQ